MQLLLSNITFKIDIKQWMSQDKLLMKDAKTEFLLIGTRQQLAKVTIDSITIGRFIIAPQSPVRNLGLRLDSNLSMGDHMTKTSSAAFYYCTISREWRSTLANNVLKLWYMPLFLAELTIVIACYMAYGRIRFRNCKESRTLLCTPCIRRKQILPYYTIAKSPTLVIIHVTYRIVFKILLLTFKAIHKRAPPLHFRTSIYERHQLSKIKWRQHSIMQVSFHAEWSIFLYGWP